MYIKSLYKEKREGESQKDIIRRRLSFKLPIAIRYSVVGAGLLGVVLSLFIKRKIFVKTLVVGAPLFMLGLCWEEI